MTKTTADNFNKRLTILAENEGQRGVQPAPLSQNSGRQAIIDKLKIDLPKPGFEDSKESMYADSFGNVTVGAGFLVRNPKEIRDWPFVGADGKGGYPQMIGAIRRGDYEEAARQSKINGISDNRNKHNYDLFIKGGEEVKQPKQDKPVKGSSLIGKDQVASTDDEPLPSSRFVGVWDKNDKRYKPHPKMDDPSDLTTEEKGHRNDLFSLLNGLMQGQLPKEDTDNEYDQGFLMNGKAGRRFGFVERDIGKKPGSLFFIPDDPPSPKGFGATSEKRGPQGILESAFEFMQALSGKPKVTTPPIVPPKPEKQEPETSWDGGVISELPREKPSLGELIQKALPKHNPYAFENDDLDQPAALEAYENIYGQKADSTLRGVLTDKTHPYYGRVMKNRSRLSQRAYDKPRSMTGLSGSKPGDNLF